MSGQGSREQPTTNVWPVAPPVEKLPKRNERRQKRRMKKKISVNKKGNSGTKKRSDGPMGPVFTRM